MIITVTPNTAVDQTLLIPELPPNQTLRATTSIVSMGAKPTDAAWILGEMRVPSLALGFAAGMYGRRVVELLELRNVHVDFTWVEGETRLNTVIICADGRHNTITTSTLKVSAEHIHQLRERYLHALEDASCIIIGGSLPRDVPLSLYPDFIRLAKEREIPVIFDTDMPYLSEGLRARPDYIKPNRHELEALVGKSLPNLEDVYHAASSILESCGTVPIVSLGSVGALVVTPRQSYFIPPLPVSVVSAAGAGDAILAGLAAAIDRGDTLEEGLRLGTAAAGAVCMQLGTADCRYADIEQLLPQVQLCSYPAEERMT